MMGLLATQALTVLVVQVVSMVQEVLVDQELHRHLQADQVIVAAVEVAEAVVLALVPLQAHCSMLVQ
jgi:hypothetical protein